MTKKRKKTLQRYLAEIESEYGVALTKENYQDTILEELESPLSLLVYFREVTMKELFRSLATLLFLVTIFGCSKDDNPTGPEDKDFVYPLKIGNKWEYSREFSVFNFRPDTTGVTPPDTTIFSNSVVEIVRTDTLLDSIKTYVFHECLTEEDSSSYESESYYSNHEDGLYFHAYRSPGHVIPKPLAKKRIYFKGRYFSNIREITSFIENAIPNRYAMSDSLYYEHPPLKNLQYPIKIASQWVYREPGNPWGIDKKVLGKEKVRVPAGDFNCYKVQWLIDLDDNGEWD